MWVYIIAYIVIALINIGVFYKILGGYHGGEELICIGCGLIFPLVWIFGAVCLILNLPIWIVDELDHLAIVIKEKKKKAKN